MARSAVATKMPLDNWFAWAGVNPLHANQLYADPITLCGQPWMSHPWQASDRISREDLALAIRQAESDIESYLHYRLRPTWEVDEWKPTDRPYRPEFINFNNQDIRGFSQTARLGWKHFISGGVEAKTLVQADAAIVYSDADADGYKETATITVAVNFPSACEVALYFPNSNAMVPAGGLDEWEIRPAKASISAGSATIVVRRELLVKPELLEEVIPSASDPVQRALVATDDANFLTAVDVYRHYNDPQLQVNLLWEPYGCDACGGTGTDCAVCAFSVQSGCFLVRGDPRNSIVPFHPATWDAATLSFTQEALAQGRQPDILRAWYLAGLRDKTFDCPTFQMAREWEYTVAVYAASLLDRPICNCENAKAWVDRWQLDRSEKPAEGGVRQISSADLDNPFGTRSGAIYAWKRVKQAAVGEAAA